MLLLETVAEVALAVELLAGKGGEFFDGIDVVEAVAVLEEAEAAGIGLLEQGAVLLGDAADGEGIAPVRGKLVSASMGGLDVAGADGEGEKGHVLVAELVSRRPSTEVRC